MREERSTGYNTGCILYYSEIFSSIQGESTDTGRPCTFIRLYGCNVGCSMCDTKQIPSQRKRISVEHAVDRVISLKVPYVCITGGEPLLQPKLLYPLVYELLYNKFEVSIETSGCVPLEPSPYLRSYKYVMDIKCPSSGVSYKNIMDNIYLLQGNDEIKFVIRDKKDYEFARNIVNSYNIPAKILFSPMFEDGRPTISHELVEWIIKDKLFHVRVQLQIHKFLNCK